MKILWKWSYFQRGNRDGQSAFRRKYSSVIKKQKGECKGNFTAWWGFK